MMKKNSGTVQVNASAASLTRYSCPYCLNTFDTFEGIKSHIIADHRTESLPEPEGTIHLTINGQKYRFQVESDWTLHYLIHDKLGLTGTKLMCDRGACGSCTVIMNGRPILSCMTLAVECHGKQIETVEGIAAANHPLDAKNFTLHATPPATPMMCFYQRGD